MVITWALKHLSAGAWLDIAGVVAPLPSTNIYVPFSSVRYRYHQLPGMRKDRGPGRQQSAVWCSRRRVHGRVSAEGCWSLQPAADREIKTRCRWRRVSEEKYRNTFYPLEISCLITLVYIISFLEESNICAVKTLYTHIPMMNRLILAFRCETSSLIH